MVPLTSKADRLTKKPQPIFATAPLPSLTVAERNISGCSFGGKISTGKEKKGKKVKEKERKRDNWS
jgi:hypothetical protein